MTRKEYKEFRDTAEKLLDLWNKHEKNGVVYGSGPHITDNKYGIICRTDIGYLYEGLESIVNYGMEDDD